MQTGAHLHFNGNCSEALSFYARLLGGRIAFRMTYAESPAAAQTPPALRNQIIHARLEVGGQFLLGCDTPPERYRTPQGFNVMLAVETPEEAERVFNALADNGTVTMPFQETFWARRFGMCTDRFGIPWMINCAKPGEAMSGTPRGRA
jgi:PhnB protein